jgi:hypothetical protein
MARWLERHVGERVVEVAAQRLGAGCVAAHDHREDATAKVARIGPAREIEGLGAPRLLAAGRGGIRVTPVGPHHAIEHELGDDGA